MPIPTRVELDQAIRSAQVRLRVSDPELKHGAVEMVRYETRAGPMEEPWGMEGGFAVVYKFRMQSGRLRAMRVFKRLMPADMAQRYRLMHPYFRQHVPACTVECIYHEQGVLVKHQSGGQDVYPLLEMEWVEGETLIECVDRLCAAGDRTRLRDLAGRWQGLFCDLRAAEVAHGDLSGGNVLVRPDGALVLIDYDGVFTPELAQFQPVVAGQPDYQHPQSSRRAFSAGMDEFSFLVIYTALLALSTDPSLWAGHTQRGPRGNLLNENLLFRRDDFERPEQSALMARLSALAHPDVTRALEAVRAAAGGPIEAVSLPEALLGPGAAVRQQLGRLLHAIWLGDNRAIVACWTDDLVRHPQAQVHAGRVRAAKQYLAALARLRVALVAGNDVQIAAACGRELEQDPLLTATERQRIDLARRRNAALLKFHQALAGDDDSRIIDGYDALLDGYPAVQSTERARLTLARHRFDALRAFRFALYKDDDELIVSNYSSVLNGSPLVEASERERLSLARRRAPALRGFAQALADDDDERITAAYHPALEGCLAFDEAARARLGLARRRMAALTAFRQAVISRDERQIVASFDSILVDCAKVLPAELAILRRAQECLGMPERVRAALSRGDDVEIERAFRPDLVRSWMDFTDGERARVELAAVRVATLLSLRRALAAGDDEAIVAAYDPVLDGYSRLTDDERARIATAQERLAGLRRLRQVMARGDDDGIIAVAAEEGAGDLPLTPAELNRLDLARQRAEALARLRQALQTDDDDLIMQVYNQPLRGYSRLYPEERARIDLARRRLDTFAHLQQAAERDDDEGLALAYDAIVEGRRQLDASLAERLALARRRVAALTALRAALAAGDERAIVREYDPGLLDHCRAVLPQERQRLAEARRCLAYPRALRHALATDDDATIAATVCPGLARPWMAFTTAEDERGRLARDRLDALERFRAALAGGDEQAIVQAYDARLLDGYHGLAADERARLAAAAWCLGMPERLRRAVEAGDDEAIASAYDPALVCAGRPLDEALVQAATRAQARLTLRREIHEALALGAVEAALRLERCSAEGLADARLDAAKRDYLRTREPGGLVARLEGETLTASWRWPQSRLIEQVLLAWRTDRWPDAATDGAAGTLLVGRDDYERAGRVRQHVGDERVLYVRLYSAMALGGDGGLLLSPGGEPSARRMAIRRSGLLYSVEPDGSDGQAVLVVETSGGEPLPALCLVSSDDGLPLTVAEGRMLAQLPAGLPHSPGRARLPLALADLGPTVRLRLFASDDASDWRPVSGRIGLKTG